MTAFNLTPNEPKESDVLSSCLRYLNGMKIFVWRSNNMGVTRVRGGKTFHTFNGLRGVADILGVTNDGTGRILAIECKRPGKMNNQSEEQKEFEKMINQSNGIYLLVDSWEMLDKKLKEKGIIN
jgi:hypothetical protein